MNQNPLFNLTLPSKERALNIMKTTTNANLTYFVSIRNNKVFKPIMVACDCISDAFDGKKAIISVSKKISIELTKMGQSIDGKLFNGKSLISSYRSEPETIANFLNNDLLKMGGVR
jgi:hypothetical protein